jgi:hypothetical protein
VLHPVTVAVAATHITVLYPYQTMHSFILRQKMRRGLVPVLVLVPDERDENIAVSCSSLYGTFCEILPSPSPPSHPAHFLGTVSVSRC